MKSWLKWAQQDRLVALLAAGPWRTWQRETTNRRRWQAQQQAQKAPVAMALRPADLLLSSCVDLPLTLPISGTVKAVHTAFVKGTHPRRSARTSVREGDAVKSGQVLARIDPQESQPRRLNQPQSQAQAARAQVDIAQRSFDNSRALVSQGFISSTALETAQANLAQRRPIWQQQRPAPMWQPSRSMTRCCARRSAVRCRSAWCKAVNGWQWTPGCWRLWI
jgi:multidrug efflux pump subunit AcrA (membrane-fusion protein)